MIEWRVQWGCWRLFRRFESALGVRWRVVAVGPLRIWWKVG